MKHLKTDTLILGATFYGCGLACAMPEAMLIDSTITVGSDYALSFDPGSDWQCPLAAPEAEEFRQDLIRRRALTADGRLLTGALAPVLADWCIRHNVKPLFGMELVCKKGNVLTFTDFSGNQVLIEARRVIDARCVQGAAQSLTFAIHSKEIIMPGDYGKISVKAAPVDKLYYGSIDIDERCDMIAARQILKACWTARPSELSRCQIIWTAMRLSRNPFANPAAALDAGSCGKINNTVLPDTASPRRVRYDTVVVGLGTAGSLAAITAARRGAKVLAIEKNFYPGGVWTGGFVPRSYLQQTGGAAKELQDRSEQREDCFSLGEQLRTELECAALDAGVTIEYGAVPVQAEKEGTILRKIIYRDHNGALTEVEAYTFIDSSADAVLCNMAGCELTCGRQEDKEFNSYTNSMGMLTEYGVAVANFDAGRTAQYDTQDLSRSFLSSLQLHLREDYTQERSCLQISDNPGVREGLRIAPRKPYTLEDYFKNNGSCEEPIFTVISNLDTHAQDLFFESEVYLDWTIAASAWEIRLSIPVPLQVLFPKQVDGLIAAARHLGVDHDLGNAVRMISGMTAIGEAAGNIAVLAQKSQIQPREVPYSEIKKYLPAAPEAYSKSAVHLNASGSNKLWYAADDEEIRSWLCSDDPALGIWNVKQQNKMDLAREIMATSPAGGNAFKSAVLALALCGDNSVIPQLMQIIKEDDREPVNLNMRFSAQRRIAAVYLLGRLRQSGPADFLKTLLPQKECDKLLGHTVAALIKIGDANAARQEDIGRTLHDLACDDSWHVLEQLKGPGAGLRRADGLIRLHIARALDRWNIRHDLAQIAAKLDLDAHEHWLWQQYVRTVR